MESKYGIDCKKLRTAMEVSRRSLRRFRTNRTEMVRQYVGRHWSEEGSHHIVPYNLIALYISIMQRHLVPQNPRVMMSTFNIEGKPAVTAAESWANRHIEKIYFAETLERLVLDAMFSIGIAKVCLLQPTDSAVEQFKIQSGEVGIRRIDLDDFAYDMNAKEFSHARWIGHRYRAPLRAVKEDQTFNKQRKDLQATPDLYHNRDGDERISSLGRQYYGSDQNEYDEWVDLWEIYFPAENVVVTLVGDEQQDFEKPLREQEWIGPPCGPYHFLTYGTVPGNAMPKAPIQDLFDFHLFINRTYRKLMRQADRTKKNTLVTRTATEDGKRVVEANDGDAIPCDDPSKINEITQGGIDNLLLQMGIHGADLFSKMAGNLDMMGGLGPQSPTASQDKMLFQSASMSIEVKQAQTTSFAARVLKSMAWFWWNDPFSVMRTPYSLPGLPEYAIERKIVPEQRQVVPFDELDIKIDPYSMQHISPGERAQGLIKMVMQIVLPAMPILQQSGGDLNMSVLLNKLAKYLDMPDLPEILGIAEPQQAQAQTQKTMPAMPKDEERTTYRETRPTRTSQGDHQNMMNSLMGIDTGGNPNRNGQGSY